MVDKPSSRRFPPPWSVDDPDMKLGQDCFIVRAGLETAKAAGSETARDGFRPAARRLRSPP